jgi:hypothetical protein
MFRVRYRRRGSFAADRGDKQKEAPPRFGVFLTKEAPPGRVAELQTKWDGEVF